MAENEQKQTFFYTEKDEDKMIGIIQSDAELKGGLGGGSTGQLIETPAAVEAPVEEANSGDGGDADEKPAEG